MIQFRPFRNDDTPALVELWRSQPAMRGMVQPVTASILERYVFSKLYFDRHGLIVAHADDRILGVAHAGFGPNDELSWIGRENGVISLVLVTTEFPEREALARQLIEHAEGYLQSHGALRVYGGEYYPHSPFYFGLYGGSNAAGILESDVWHQNLFPAAGYARTDSTQILHCRLAEFRAVVNRQQMAIRRRTIVEPHIDALPRNWWDAQMASQHDFTSFRLTANDRRAVWAEAMFWDMEPLASSWGIHAAGLLDCEQFDACGEPGAETFLIGDSLKQLQANGVTLVETQVNGHAEHRLRLLTELGFQIVDTGTTFMKTLQQT